MLTFVVGQVTPGNNHMCRTMLECFILFLLVIRVSYLICSTLFKYLIYLYNQEDNPLICLIIMCAVICGIVVFASIP